MSWSSRYREEARKWRHEAHMWTLHGKEIKAREALDIAETYEVLAEEAEKHEQIRSESR